MIKGWFDDVFDVFPDECLNCGNMFQCTEECGLQAAFEGLEA